MPIDDAAFTDLYLRHFDRIYGFLRMGLGNAHDAEDAVQQVFLQVYRALPRYDPGRAEPVEAWLFTIARNQMISAARARRRVEPADPARIQEERDRSSVHAGPPVSGGWIEDGLLLAAVERLPNSQRHVIAMRYVLGFTSREISLVLGRSPHAVRQLHHRALRSIERELDQQQAACTEGTVPSVQAASSSVTVKISHGVPSGSCTQILSCLA